VAVFLTEMCPQRLRGPLAFLTELPGSGFQGVIYGLWAVLCIGTNHARDGQPILNKYLGWTTLLLTMTFRPGLGYMTQASFWQS